MRNKIILLTHSYPFNLRSETFLDTEIRLIPPNCDVTILPLFQSNNDCRMFNNDVIHVDESLSKRSFIDYVIVFIYMIFSKYFWGLFLYVHKIKKIKDGIKYLYGAYFVYFWLKNAGEKYDSNTVFYTYWFTNAPLGLALYKLKHGNFKNKIISRAHGHDVYEGTVGVFIPYRNLIFSMIDSLFSISETGRTYLSSLYPEWKDKIRVSRLGVYPMKRNPYIPLVNNIRIVSCSSIISLKRIDLLFMSILRFCMYYPSYSIVWTHIGDGPLMGQIRKLIEISQSENLVVNMLGFVKNDQIQDIYNAYTFDVFINVSESEGIPVSIMECISCGIPVIATDVGGNHEIVTNSTGILITKEFNQEEFNAALLYVIENRDWLRENTYNFFHNNYNAITNYSNFYELITYTMDNKNRLDQTCEL